MSKPLWVLLACLTVAMLLLWVRQLRGRLAEARRERDTIEDGEGRMFDFLHVLGLAIDHDELPYQLHRVIVDGIAEVVGARGGGLYLVAEDGKHLVPTYLSEACPPLVVVPDEVAAKAATDPRALESHLRLARVAINDSLLGGCLVRGTAGHVADLLSEPGFRNVGLLGRKQIELLVAPLWHVGKALGVLAVGRVRSDGGFTANDLAVFRSVAEQAGFALGNALAHIDAREKRRLEDELRNAREVQRVLLPGGEPVIPGFRVFGMNIPARIISGDYYDYLDLGDGRHGVVIADVSGKGVPAGLVMATCRSALRSVAPGEHSPTKVLAAVNRQLFPDIREDMFISMVYIVIDGVDGRLRLARAGHDAPLLFRKRGGEVSELRPPGLAVGIDEGDVFERVTRDLELNLEPGDCLLLHTDGVREAVDAQECEFGLERELRIFSEHAALGAEVVVTAIQREVRAFAGTAAQMDDVTLIAIEKR
jgi:sigma-B regulation protein RsbU (phosphoserine phosphatase)